MREKLIIAYLGLFACATSITPAAVSASPVLTQPTGTTLDASVKSCEGVSGRVCATGHNLGVIKLKDTSGNTLMECSSASLTGYMTTNSGVEVIGTITSVSVSSTGTNGECTSTSGGVTVDTNIGGGTPWCIRSSAKMEPNEFQVVGGSCGAAGEITFVLTSTTIGSCKYTRNTIASALKGTYTTHSTGDAVLSLVAGANTAFSKEEGGIFCPSETTLEMSFTLETDSPNTEPLYIS